MAGKIIFIETIPKHKFSHMDFRVVESGSSKIRQAWLAGLPNPGINLDVVGLFGRQAQVPPLLFLLEDQSG